MTVPFAVPVAPPTAGSALIPGGSQATRRKWTRIEKVRRQIVVVNAP